MTELHEVQKSSQPIGRYIAPTTLADAFGILAEHGPAARPIVGGTDLLLEVARGARPGVNVLVDLSRIVGLDQLTATGDIVRIGPLVTHGDIVSSPELRHSGLPLVQACAEVGSPQLRNRATVVGNIVTASPANDTLSALYALGAKVSIESRTGSRTLNIDEFCTGFRQTDLAEGDLVTEISFDALLAPRRGIFVKLGLRKAQAISVVHAAVVVETATDGTIADIRVAVGSVAPTVVLVQGLRDIAVGRTPTDAAADVGAVAAASVTPIDDLRATAKYRSGAVGVVVERAMVALDEGAEAAGLTANTPRLSSRCQVGELPRAAVDATDSTEINVTVNGEARSGPNGASKTLLDWLRDEAKLTGTKEGCAEGECGACTVHMDGDAVLSCLIKAASADGAEVTTIEGIADQESLHPVQKALADAGAVQCGFCTPGFVMSATMLGSEVTSPTRDQIENGLAGNLCRCTGYYGIIEAVERAAADKGSS